MKLTFPVSDAYLLISLFQQVESFSYEIAENSQQRAQNLVAVLHSLSDIMSAYGTSTVDTDSVWPYETFPGFEDVVANYRRVCRSRMIATLPLVQDMDKSKWEAYAYGQQDWISESYESIGLDVVPLPIHPTIYDINSGHATEALEGPFMPLWQISPPPPNSGIVNYNLMSNENLDSALKIAVEVREPLFSQITDLSFLIDAEDHAHESLLIQPIVLDADDHNSQVVAAILATVSWDEFFSDLVRDGNQDMYVVLKNSCSDKVTWKLNGKEAVFVGLDDFHDQTYDEYEHVVKLTSFLTSTALSTPGYCEYEIHIYPSYTIEQLYISSRPKIFATITVMVFAGLLISFVVYDRLVRKRQQETQERQAKSEAIVQSMFPAQIRDRLLKEEGKDDNKLVADEQKDLMNGGQKFRLKSFLDREETLDPEDGGVIKETKPIADLFPNTTVMFADISGFTAWSSVREPSQVFTLLETVYKAFDKTAKRRKVFKVETVG